MADYTHDPAAETSVPDTKWVLADRFVKSDSFSGKRSKGTSAWLLFFTHGGLGGVRGAGGETLCRRGDVTIIKPGTPHDYYSKEALWDFYWVYFVPRSSWQEWLQFPESDRGIVSISLEEDETFRRLTAVFKRLLDDCRQMNEIRQELALGAVEEIMLLLAGRLKERSSRIADGRVVRVLEEINRNYAAPHSVYSLAGLVCLSPSRLAHLFKEQTGESIVDALNRVRLEQAARLLRFTSLSVAEVSEQAGFRSLNFFGSKFKQQFGVSPSAYRVAR